MVHSEKVFNPVTKFDSAIWYKVYFKETLIETISNESEWRYAIEKQVNINELTRNLNENE